MRFLHDEYACDEHGHDAGIRPAVQPSTPIAQPPPPLHIAYICMGMLLIALSAGIVIGLAVLVWWHS